MALSALGVPQKGFEHFPPGGGHTPERSREGDGPGRGREVCRVLGSRGSLLGPAGAGGQWGAGGGGPPVELWREVEEQGGPRRLGDNGRHSETE